jgi:hypothetical protein
MGSWRLDRCFFLSLDVADAPSGHTLGGAAVTPAPFALRALGVALVGKEQGPLLEGLTYENERGMTKKLFPSDHKGCVFSFGGAP